MSDESQYRPPHRQDAPAYEGEEPIQTIGFVYPGEENAGQRADSGVLAFADSLCGGLDSPEKVGTWLYLLWHKLGRGPWRTDAEFADFLNKSKGRLSQIQSEIPDVFAPLMKCNRRNAKPRAMGDE